MPGKEGLARTLWTACFTLNTTTALAVQFTQPTNMTKKANTCEFAFTVLALLRAPTAQLAHIVQKVRILRIARTKHTIQMVGAAHFARLPPSKWAVQTSRTTKTALTSLMEKGNGDCSHFMDSKDGNGDIEFVPSLNGGMVGPGKTNYVIWVVRAAGPLSIAQPPRKREINGSFGRR